SESSMAHGPSLLTGSRLAGRDDITFPYCFELFCATLILAMKFTHQTGTATLIQASIMWLLNVATQAQASIESCMHHDSCTSGIVINLLFVLVLGVWLMFLSAVGYFAEERRSRKFAT